MPWMKLIVPIAESSQTYNDIAKVIFRVLDATPPDDVGSALAIYRTEGDETATFHLSPAAAAVLAGKTRFNFTICPRPDLDPGALMIGDTAAKDTAWVELPDDRRQPEPFDPVLAEAQDIEWRALHDNGGGDDKGEPA